MSDYYSDDLDDLDLGVDDAPLQPVDPLEAAYRANPAAVQQAIADRAAERAWEQGAQELLARQQEIANQKNAEIVALEVVRDLQTRVPDFEELRDRVQARLIADPTLIDDVGDDPAAAARRVADQFQLVRAENEKKKAADDWWHVQRGALQDAPYWDSRRKLLDVPRSKGGFGEDDVS